MAIITDNIVAKFWRALYRKGAGVADIQTGQLPSTVQLKAAIQAIEDRWDADKLGYKADIDAAIGFTTTNAQAKVLGRYWLEAKAERGNV